MESAEELMLETALEKMREKQDREFEMYGDHSAHEDEIAEYWEQQRLEEEGYDE